MKKFKFKFITSFWNEFSYLLRSCSCLLGPYLAGWCIFDVVYILCLALARVLGCYLHRAHFCVLRVALLFQVIVVVEGDGVTKCARRIGGDGEKAKSQRLRLSSHEAGGCRNAIA
jgi:hypothetical protein